MLSLFTQTLKFYELVQSKTDAGETVRTPTLRAKLPCNIQPLTAEEAAVEYSRRQLDSNYKIFLPLSIEDTLAGFNLGYSLEDGDGHTYVVRGWEGRKQTRFREPVQTKIIAYRNIA